jgi:hypothetical protein
LSIYLLHVKFFSLTNHRGKEGLLKQVVARHANQIPPILLRKYRRSWLSRSMSIKDGLSSLLYPVAHARQLPWGEEVFGRFQVRSQRSGSDTAKDRLFVHGQGLS